jgi:hypothetical protein
MEYWSNGIYEGIKNGNIENNDLKRQNSDVELIYDSSSLQTLWAVIL